MCWRAVPPRPRFGAPSKGPYRLSLLRRVLCIAGPASGRSVLFERPDIRDVVPLDLPVVPVGADRDTDVHFHAAEDLVSVVGRELRQIELRIQLGKGRLGATSAVSAEGRVEAQGALLVLVLELEDPDQHRLVGRLTQGVLDRVDVPFVDATRDDLVGRRLDTGQVDDLRQIVLVGVLSVVVSLVVSVVSGCVERRCLFDFLGCLAPRGRRCGVAPLLSRRRGRPTGRGGGLRRRACHWCHIQHPFGRVQ